MICAFSRNVQPSQQQLSMKSNTHGLDTTQPRAAENIPELGLIINSHGKGLPCSYLREGCWNEGFVIVALHAMSV